jgi:nucleoside 2-deoxyribosyltransferase
MKRKIYLAGPIFGAADPSYWRQNATAYLQHNWEVINPLVLEATVDKPDELVAIDLRTLRECHAVLAKVNEPSWGTAMEIFFAAGIGLPVIGWRPLSDGPDSPWLRHHTRGIYRGLAEAVSHIEALR